MHHLVAHSMRRKAVLEFLTRSELNERLPARASRQPAGTRPKNLPRGRCKFYQR